MEQLLEWLQELWKVISTQPLLAGLISTVLGGLIVLLIWDWRQGYSILATSVRRGLILTVLVASISVSLVLLSLLIPPGPPPPPPPPPPPQEAINYPRLLGKEIGDPEIKKAFSELGLHEEKALLLAGREFCFRDRGVDFRFERRGTLDTIAFFYGLPGEAHATFRGEFRGLPLKNFRFMQARERVREIIRVNLMTPPILRRGADYDEYELTDYRLCFVYGTFDGGERVQEVRLARHKDLPDEQASLAR